MASRDPRPDPQLVDGQRIRKNFGTILKQLVDGQRIRKNFGTILKLRAQGEPDTLTLQVQDRSAPGLRLLSRPRIRFSVVAKSRAGVLVGLDGREASV